MDTPAFLGSQRKEESHGFHPCHGGEGIVEVDPLLLHETACHQASLVLDDGAGFIPFQLEYPIKGDRAITTSGISKHPSPITLNRVHHRLHRKTPLRPHLIPRKAPSPAVAA